MTTIIGLHHGFSLAEPRPLAEGGQRSTPVMVCASSGAQRLHADLYIALADRVNPAVQFRMDFEYSTDSGRTWVPHGAALFVGSVTRDQRVAPTFAVRPLPPRAAAVRLQFTNLGAPVTELGAIVRVR